MKSSENPAAVTNSPSRKTRRTLRVRIACLRCQRRKIRCDGAVPSCGSCLKIGTECVDGGQGQNHESPRAHITSLQTRVRWLETIIRTRCPDVNLDGESQVFNVDNETIMASGGSTPKTTNISDGFQEYQQETHLERHPDPDLDPDHPRENAPAQDQSSNLRHEIGLVSLSAGTDPKYIGPSSGYSFARLLLACAARQGHPIPPSNRRAEVSDRFAFLLPKDSVSEPLPLDMNYTTKLSNSYFETIHPQYPFLHQPSHEKLVRKVYEEADPSPVDVFQVNMVLAISAIIISRRLKISLPGAGYCASAMKFFDKIYLENSLRGLQCLLLLLVYTFHSSSLGLNVWYLNYQCISALLDLGLQRDVKSGRGISVLEQELRTRTFWVIYTIDRQVATMMGRPIGLRDEACELRLPADVDDYNLSATGIRPRQEGEPPTHMSCAIHLFKLAQINSEIKYICHSISHKPPPYSYPNIPDFSDWQKDIDARLHSWKQQIPQFTGERIYMTRLCERKYHKIMMLLHGPSPAIPKPSLESSKACYQSAVAEIRLYSQLYKQDLLVYSWVTVHSIFLSTLTMLHCIWTVSAITVSTQIDDMVAILKAGSNVLSATGEHWSEAKRSRDVLDGLSVPTIRWLLDHKAKSTQNGANTQGNHQGPTQSSEKVAHITPTGNLEGLSSILSFAQSTDLNFDGEYWGSALYGSINGDLSFTEEVDFNDPATLNAIMQGMLTTDVHIGSEYGPDFGMALS
ncbi:Positive regulator of purine utilization [Lachnellula hyalina]|uniref:Positive regulator of purine utilization n=1 Tax=Lachnellula hyalina TaxID=1316788 RepID=A0A8H8U0E0_9HELO|nr:Positive regulator of purine utilization [Lachnellula hyalina]TVY29184.1 Positive regulator of purine utilization [Lachnellula hyalina]